MEFLIFFLSFSLFFVLQHSSYVVREENLLFDFFFGKSHKHFYGIVEKTVRAAVLYQVTAII